MLIASLFWATKDQSEEQRALAVERFDLVRGVREDLPEDIALELRAEG